MGIRRFEKAIACQWQQLGKILSLRDCHLLPRTASKVDFRAFTACASILSDSLLAGKHTSRLD